MTTLWPAWFNKLLPEQKKFALEKRGMNFIFRFLFKKGHHLFIIGTTGSGKTQKAYWCARWISTTKETIVWIDSAKNREMIPLMNLGKPVRIICPKGCDVQLTEWSDDDHKYVRMKHHPEVIQVPDPQSAWWAVKNGAINIFCFRVAFGSDNAARDWMGGLFSALSVDIRKNRFPKILPIAIFGDESHWFLAGEKVTTDEQRRKLAEMITELSLEDRAHGVRLVLMAQSHKSLPPASRENMIHTLVCRGCKVSAEENNILSQYNSYTSKYQPNEGTFVYEGGYAYPCNPDGVGFPWPFPFFQMPKIKVEYMGEFDSPTEQRIVEEEIEAEMVPDLNKYQGIMASLEGYEIPKDASRYDAIIQEVSHEDTA